MAAYDFKVDFSPIGQLPEDYRLSQQNKGTQEALKDLDTSSYKSLSDAAARVLRLGGDPKTAIALYNAASTRYAAEMRAAEMQQYNRNLPAMLAASRASGAGTPPVAPVDEAPPGGIDPLSNIKVPGAPAPAPAAAPAATPGMPPGTNWPAPPPALGPRSEASPSPSEAIIAKAQGGMAPSIAPATQLAGPPPTPDTAPPDVPNLALQSGMMPRPPGAMAPGAAPVPSGPAPGGPALAPMQGLQAEASKLANDYIATSTLHSANSPGSRMLLEKYKEALGQLYPNNPTWKEYQADRLQRRASGEPDVPFRLWKAEPKIQEDLSREVIKAYSDKGGYRDEMMKAERQKNVLDQMDVIMKNPDFISGNHVQTVAKGLSSLAAISKAARSIGIPEDLIPNVDEIAALKGPLRSARLAEAFTGLSNQMVYATLGTLGNQISEGDRNYVDQMYPTLSKSKEGNVILSSIMRKIVERTIDAGKAAQEYRSSRHALQQNVPAMDKYVQDKVKEPMFVNADGSLTSEGQAAFDKIKALSATPEAPATGGAPTRTKAFVPAPYKDVPQAVGGAVGDALNYLDRQTGMDRYTR